MESKHVLPGNWAVIAAIAVVCLAPMNSRAGNSAKPVDAGTDIPGVWRADQHLYVKGNVGVSSERLDELEKWLDANAPNWTVLLAETAAGEQFQSYRGMDAVEHALGKGLPNDTPFGELTHPETGEKSGAFFILFLKDRKLSYYGSDAYDRRRLGDEHWIGNLDKPAIQAMRGGGRVIDAAKDTIENIDGLLARRIASEESERKKLAESARTAIEVAEELMTYTGEKADAFAEAAGRPDGDIANPDLPAWKGVLVGARENFNNGEHAKARDEARDLEKALRAHLRKIEDHGAAKSVFAQLHSNLAGILPHPESARAPQLHAQTQRALAAAEEAHAGADSAFLSHLEEAKSAFQLLLRENESTMRRLVLEEQHRRQVRNLQTAAAGGGAALFAGFLVFLNRNRRGSRRRAETLLAERRESFKTKRNALFELLDRCAMIVGTQAELEESDTAGETLALSRDTLRDVDELFIMSSCVDRVIDEAGNLIRPEGMARGVRNLFFKGGYAAGYRLLEDELVRFSPEEGLAEILHRKREDGKETRLLLKDGAAREGFELTFENLVSEFDMKAGRAGESLDVLENAWETIIDAIEKLGYRLKEAVACHDALVEAGSVDGLFLLPAMASKVTPFVEDRIVEATGAAGSDPVRTLRGVIAGTGRQLEEVLQLLEGILERRRNDFPGMRAVSGELRALGRKTEWISRTLDERSGEADAMLASSLDRSVRDEAEALLAELSEMRDTVSVAKALADRVSGPARENLAGALNAAGAGRREIGAALGVPDTAILNETPQLNPDEYLGKAEKLIGPAEAALDRGGVAAAEAALDEIDALVAEAEALVGETRRCFEGNAERWGELDATRGALAERLEEHRALLAQLVERYKKSALHIALANPETGEGRDEDITDHVIRCEKGFAEMGEELMAAEAQHRKGQIFGAAAGLDRVANLQGAVEEWYGEIRGQGERVAALEAANVMRVRQLDERIGRTRRVLEDPKVMLPTVEAFESAEAGFSPAREASEAPYGQADPFHAYHLLQGVEAALEDVDRQVAADRSSHEEAARALGHVKAQLEAALSWVAHARGDGIPDSPATSQSIRGIESADGTYAMGEEKLHVPHGDWPALGNFASDLLVDLSRSLAELKGDLEEARESLTELNRANREVQNARGSAGFLAGIFSATDGEGDLDLARRHLRRGDYAGVIRLARRSSNAAKLAVVRSEQAARRRRSSSFGSSGSSFGGGGSSFGGGSSGSSRSSFSSGSGVSRSGW